MPVSIDEVSADVSAPENRGSSSDKPAAPSSTSPSEQRRQKEQLERMQQRAARVCAN
jgi:hypothetical protein